MNFEPQPNLENALVKLVPLKNEDFDILYQVASDPLIWEQHPDRFRYKKEVFEKYFEGVLKSGGAFIVKEKKSDEVIGSSRYYDYDEVKKSIVIGYTFLARKYWGTAYNGAMKKLMLDHAFQFVETVIFHIGDNNFRSQRAIEKLGAIKIGEVERKNLDDDFHITLIYILDKVTWSNIRNEKEGKAK